MAQFLHVKDKRKVINALFKYFKMLHITVDGIESLLKQSDVFKKQETLRFLPILVWMSADKAILEQRIRKRIQSMIDQKQPGGMSGLEEAMFVLD